MKNKVKCTYINEGNKDAFPWLMMTSSNGNIFRVTGPLCGEFTGPGEFPTQRSVTRSFDVFFDLRLNKRLSKQPWGWWSETPSSSLWRHRNVPESSVGQNQAITCVRRNTQTIIITIRATFVSINGRKVYKHTKTCGRIYASVHLFVIATDNELSLLRNRSISWTNDDILLIGPSAIYQSKIWNTV